MIQKPPQRPHWIFERGALITAAPTLNPTVDVITTGCHISSCLVYWVIQPQDRVEKEGSRS